MLCGPRARCPLTNRSASQPSFVESLAGKGWTEYDRQKRKKADKDIDPSLKQEFIVNPFSINADHRFSTVSPYDHIHGKYDASDDLQLIYKREPGLDHPFDFLSRIKLMVILLESQGRMGARLDPLMQMKVCRNLSESWRGGFSARVPARPDGSEKPAVVLLPAA